MFDPTMLDMINIKNKQLFWECDRGECEQFQAFGDAYYEEDDVVVLYAMHVQTQAMQRFMMRPSARQYSPRLYNQNQYANRQN
jgi:hypothetical protein